MKKISLYCILALILSSCASQTFLMNSGAKISESELDVDNPSHFFISGLGQRDTINAAEVCGSPDNVGKVETQVTFLNGLIGAVTFGIYTPYQHRVYCVKK